MRIEEFSVILCKAPSWFLGIATFISVKSIHPQCPRLMREDNPSSSLQTLGGIAFSITLKWEQLSALQLTKPYAYIRTYYI